MGLTKVKINLGTQGNLSGSRSIIQSTKTLVSSSAQLATDISGSITSVSSSTATRVAANLASINTLNGSGTAQGVGTSDSPTFNDVTVTGTLTAQEVHTEFESASVIFTSGSTIFGNSSDDVHNMTGSLNISGSLFVKDGTLTVTDNVDFNGDLDVDGTTNLDAVDIDGNVDLAGTLTTAGSTGSDYIGSFTNTSATGWGLFVKGGADNADYSLRVQDKDANDLLAVKSSGNIGIGTNDPQTVGGGKTLTIAGDAPEITLVDNASGTPYAWIATNDYGSLILSADRANEAGSTYMRMDVDGTEAMRIDSSQRVVIGTTSALSDIIGYNPLKLGIEGTNYTGGLSVIEHQNGISGGVVAIGKSRGTSVGSTTILQTNDIAGRLAFVSADGVDFRVISAEIRTLVGASPAANDVPGHLLFMTNDGSGVDSTERMRIASDGKVFIGSTASRTLSGVTPQVQVEGLDYGTSSMSLIGNTGTDAGTAPLLMFGRSRGTSDGTSTAVASGDRLGAIFFTGADGTDINTVGAYIEASVDGSVSGNTMPGRLVFYTNSGGSSASEKMRISKDGKIKITNQLDIDTNSSSIYPSIVGQTADYELFRLEQWYGNEGALVIKKDGNVVIRFTGGQSGVASYINNGANFGIGETAPLNKLYVVETESKAVATFYNTRNPSNSPPHGLDINFAYTPDNTTSYFVRGQDNLGSSAVAEFHIYSDGSFVQSSDRRMKENIVDSENQLDKINQLKVRDYNKINDSSKKKHIGFIAQELQEVFPHLVIEAEDEAKTLQIYKVGIVPLLVKAVQELSAKVEALEST